MNEILKKASDLLSTEVVCALITLGGIIFANLSSRWIAKEAAVKEMEKLKQTWEHDNKIAFEQAFHAMVEAVSAYILNSNISNQESARVTTAIMLTFAKGELADKIVALYSTLKRRPAPEAEELLLDVIQTRGNQRTGAEHKLTAFFRFFRRPRS